MGSAARSARRRLVEGGQQPNFSSTYMLLRACLANYIVLCQLYVRFANSTCVSLVLAGFARLDAFWPNSPTLHALWPSSMRFGSTTTPRVSPQPSPRTPPPHAATQQATRPLTGVLTGAKCASRTHHRTRVLREPPPSGAREKRKGGARNDATTEATGEGGVAGLAPPRRKQRPCRVDM